MPTPSDAAYRFLIPRANGRRAALFGCAAIVLAFASNSVRAEDAPANAAPTVASADDGGGGALAEVIVTARKREENALKVPIAITVLSGRDLSRRGITQFDSLQYSAPNITIFTPNPRQTNVSIRGLGNNPASDGLENSVGLYEDGVYLGRPGMADYDLLDIDRIEVLRGPQGTLFGKNTTAGAISITTREPQFTPEALGEATFGNYGAKQLRGYVGGPILGNVVAGRLSAYYDYRGGYLSNVATGGRDNGLNRWGLRGQLLVRPSENFDARLIASYGREDENCCTQGIYNVGPNNGAVFFQNAARLRFTPITDPKSLLADVDGYLHMNTHQTSITAEVNWRFHGYTVTSISDYRNYYVHPQNDADYTPISASLQSAVIDNVYQGSQELRLASPTNQIFDYVVGAYYFHQDIRAMQPAFYGPQADLFYNTPAGALNNISNVLYSRPVTNSYAVFGQGVWHILPVLDLTTGLRETWEYKHDILFDAGPTGATVTSATLAARSARARAYAGEVALQSANLSGLVSLDYKPTSGLMLYTSYAWGAKAGGINNVLPPAGQPITTLLVRPEKAQDVEAGAKGTFWDGKLQASADFFWMQFTDYQATAYQPGTNIMFLTNVGGVRSLGVEGEVTVAPADGLTLNASGSNTDATYTNFSNAPCPQGVTIVGGCSLTGRPVQGAPKWTAQARVDYTRPLTSQVNGYVTGQVSYKSAFYGNLDDSTYSWIKGVALVNLRLGVASADGHWDLSVFGNNIFNAISYNSVTSLNFLSYLAYANLPRTFGVTLRGRL
ncbi:MAG: TonB-dependent receptor [Caulobacteraceae bacterium]|nr:TonB-dependent receptor [Caulobacteraceae bacterium]